MYMNINVYVYVYKCVIAAQETIVIEANKNALGYRCCISLHFSTICYSVICSKCKHICAHNGHVNATFIHAFQHFK